MYAPQASGNFTLTVADSPADKTSTRFEVDSNTPIPPDSPVDPAQGFPLSIVNNTRGHWSSSDIYVTIFGQQAKDQWSYVDANGQAHHINHKDAETNPIHKDGVAYANMSFKMPSGDIKMPSNLQGGRVYISLGHPLYVGISPTDDGLALPDPANKIDPNYDTNWDHYEFTYVNGKVAFGGNTTQVDQFAFPIEARLQQAASGYDVTQGLPSESRDAIRSSLASEEDGDQNLVTSTRVLSPRSARDNKYSPTNGYDKSVASGRMAAQIDASWKEITDDGFSLTRLNQTFTGKVVDGTLHFSIDGVGDYRLAKPTVRDVWECSGALASGNDVEKALGAEFCAALNRGVATNPKLWWSGAVGATYYELPANDYARVIHGQALNGKAYAFAYDDVNSQSGVEILPNTAPPSKVTLTIGW
jgi:hypothetical protein